LRRDHLLRKIPLVLIRHIKRDDSKGMAKALTFAAVWVSGGCWDTSSKWVSRLVRVREEEQW
ncbi:MAG: hypothetical protein ACRDJ3_05625, partial [Solirubrobacteraceae bacterium]